MNAWNTESLDAMRRLEAKFCELGDIAASAMHLALQAGPLSALLRHADASAVVAQAVAQVDALPASGAKAHVWSLQCYQSMLDRDYDLSIRRGRQAIAMATAVNEPVALGRALLCTGAALLFVDIAAGREMLLALGERRRQDGQWQGVSAVLGMIGSGCGELMHLAEAEGYLRECVALCEARDWQHDYPRAWLALCCLGRGRWDEAASEAELVLQRVGDAKVSRLMAVLALARVRLRRGDPGAEALLDEARTMAEASATLQRLAPTACARAEAAFTRGDKAAVVLEVDRALPLARAKGHPWFVGELNYWLWRVGAIATAAEGCAEPYALEMAGHWREAAAQQEALAAFEALGRAPRRRGLPPPPARGRRARRGPRRPRVHPQPPLRPHRRRNEGAGLDGRGPAQRRNRRAPAPLGAHGGSPCGGGARQGGGRFTPGGGAPRGAGGLARRPCGGSRRERKLGKLRAQSGQGCRRPPQRDPRSFNHGHHWGGLTR